MESDFTATCCCPSPHLPPATDLDEEASALGNPTCEDAAINSECLQCNYHSVLPNARGFPERGVQETTKEHRKEPLLQGQSVQSLQFEVDESWACVDVRCTPFMAPSRR